ncbi:MAG TPA: EscU/YscU/HrcU family type III secretion system export apparatus switch protein [Solirubrobacteraceae bacterium]|nr:EscU/YscU/HrcU family type III secretion system export apparatus switch protein [Solirubrobacteraceae bacterium]
MPEPPGDRPRRVAALRYDAGADQAPRVVASGQGLVADRIIAEARAAGVPVRDDAALAEALAGLDLGTQVPESLYRAVAEALAWAYRLEGRGA